MTRIMKLEIFLLHYGTKYSLYCVKEVFIVVKIYMCILTYIDIYLPEKMIRPNILWTNTPIRSNKFDENDIQ
jgi:hypothetical protein